jgi:FAD/FMN-containing dehydrogenase
MADGTVLSHLGGLTKDNTGYPWHALLCGAEGTLAVVTRARLRLVTLLRERTVVLVGLASIDEAVSLAGALARDVPDLEAVELMLDAGMRLLHSQLDMPVPLARAYPVYLLAESASVQAGADALLACLTAHEVDDVAVGDDASGRDRLWEYRERHTEAINHAGVPLKLDLALPLGVYAEFVDTVPGAVASVAPGAACVCFGHIADGNVHVNVLHAERNAPAVEDTVFRLTARYGGSIAAEHGIGTAKKPWLHLCRSEAEMELGRRMKQLFDPRGVLNPHVLYG